MEELIGDWSQRAAIFYGIGQTAPVSPTAPLSGAATAYGKLLLGAPAAHDGRVNQIVF